MQRLYFVTTMFGLLLNCQVFHQECLSCNPNRDSEPVLKNASVIKTTDPVENLTIDNDNIHFAQYTSNYIWLKKRKHDYKFTVKDNCRITFLSDRHWPQST